MNQELNQLQNLMPRSFMSTSTAAYSSLLNLELASQRRGKSMLTKSTKSPTALRPSRGIKKKKAKQGIRDKAYLAFVRSFPCVICWGFPGIYTPLGTCQAYWEYEYAQGCPSQETPTEAAHFGPRALSVKASDYSCIPLCAVHHREGPAAAHKLGKNFAAHHGLDIERLIVDLNWRYGNQR